MDQQIVEPTEGAVLFAMGYQGYCPRVKLWPSFNAITSSFADTGWAISVMTSICMTNYMIEGCGDRTLIPCVRSTLSARVLGTDNPADDPEACVKQAHVTKTSLGQQRLFALGWHKEYAFA